MWAAEIWADSVAVVALPLPRFVLVFRCWCDLISVDLCWFTADLNGNCVTSMTEGFKLFGRHMNSQKYFTNKWLRPFSFLLLIKFIFISYLSFSAVYSHSNRWFSLLQEQTLSVWGDQSPVFLYCDIKQPLKSPTHSGVTWWCKSHTWLEWKPDSDSVGDFSLCLAKSLKTRQTSQSHNSCFLTAA